MSDLIEIGYVGQGEKAAHALADILEVFSQRTLIYPLISKNHFLEFLESSSADYQVLLGTKPLQFTPKKHKEPFYGEINSQLLENHLKAKVFVTNLLGSSCKEAFLKSNALFLGTDDNVNLKFTLLFFSNLFYQVFVEKKELRASFSSVSEYKENKNFFLYS